MMYKTPSQVAAQEYSFEMNAHNRTLLSQIQRASRSADAMRLYPGAFSETLVQLMKEKKLSNKKLADASLVGERTIQRLKNEEEYPTTIQTVLGLCYGLQLSVPEAEMLVGKTDFNIKPINPQNNAYRWRRVIYERINKRSCEISRDSRTKPENQRRVIRIR